VEVADVDAGDSFQQLLDALKQRAKRQYDHRVDLARADYEKQVEAIEALEPLLRDEGDTSPSFLPSELERIAKEDAARAEPMLLSQEHPALAGISSQTLIDTVANIFIKFPDSPWTVQTLEKRLLMDGFKFEAVRPKSSLKTALGKLVERHFIHVVAPGSGRKPNVYKKLPFQQPANGRVIEETK
jgi:hypothetical protein